MPSVLDRYMLREVLQMLLAVLLVLMLIFLSHRLVQYLADAAAGELPGRLVLVLVGLKAVKYLILILPLALYLAILLVLGRLYRDNEMAALSACGIGPGRLLRPVLVLAVPLAALLAWLSLQMVPWSNGVEARLIEAAQRDLDITAIAAGRFVEGREGERVIYAERVDEDGRRMNNVFVQVRLRDTIVLLSSQQAYLEFDEASGDRYLVLQNGHRYEGVPGRADYRIIEFAKHGLLIRPGVTSAGRVRVSAVPSSELWGSDDPQAAAELQWRLAVPLATLVLVLLAPPLGRVRPRKGMYGKVFVAVLVYIVYFNVLAMAETWVERGALSPVLGTWWVHGLMLLAAMVLWIRQYGLDWVLQRLRFFAKAEHPL